MDRQPIRGDDRWTTTGRPAACPQILPVWFQVLHTASAGRIAALTSADTRFSTEPTAPTTTTKRYIERRWSKSRRRPRCAQQAPRTRSERGDRPDGSVRQAVRARRRDDDDGEETPITLDLERRRPQLLRLEQALDALAEDDAGGADHRQPGLARPGQRVQPAGRRGDGDAPRRPRPGRACSTWSSRSGRCSPGRSRTGWRRWAAAGRGDGRGRGPAGAAARARGAERDRRAGPTPCGTAESSDAASHPRVPRRGAPLMVVDESL